MSPFVSDLVSRKHMPYCGSNDSTDNFLKLNPLNVFWENAYQKCQWGENKICLVLGGYVLIFLSTNNIFKLDSNKRIPRTYWYIAMFQRHPFSHADRMDRCEMWLYISRYIMHHYLSVLLSILPAVPSFYYLFNSFVILNVTTRLYFLNMHQLMS